MKKFLVALSICSFSVGATSAADLYAKAPVAAASNWTGFYLSGGGGYGLFEADQRTVGGLFPVTTQTGGRGYFGTVGGGYDLQIAPAWVVGIFGDAQFGDINGSLQDPTVGQSSLLKVETSYAAGARLGYLTAPNVLTYVNAGYSHGDFKGGQLIARDGIPNPTGVRNTGFDGWFVGGGVENSLNIFGISAPGWFMKTEYRLAEYDWKLAPIYSLATGADSGIGFSYKPYVQTVSTSLVYRFNSQVSSGGASAPFYGKAAPVRTNWSGFYLAGGGGYGLFAADQHATSNGVASTIDDRIGGRGYFGTVAGGYDWQLNPMWVFGVFADAQFGDISSDFVGSSSPISSSVKNETNYAGGARLGWLVAPNVLSYVNGGYSHADFGDGQSFVFGAGLPTTLSKSHRDGYFLGGGIENSLNIFGLSAPGWFMKTEYRLAEYGWKNSTYLSVSPSDGIAFKPMVQTVSTSLVYRFNWGQR